MNNVPELIKRIVFSGGGAKGIVYGSSYKAMIDTGVFKHVEDVSGASAGAITATLTACGIPEETFRNKLRETNLKDLMGKKVGKLSGNPPGVCLITKDGRPLYEFVRDNILTTVQDNLNELAISKISPESLCDIQKIKSKLTQNESFTFRDLSILNKNFPDVFKKLTITAVTFPTGELQVFNSDLTPDVEIALACRASASIPVVLKPVEIEIDGEMRTFVDGGLFDNLPTDYFDFDSEGNAIRNTKPNETLVLAFGEGVDDKKNQVYQALYGPRWDKLIREQLIDNVFESALDELQKASSRDIDIDIDLNSNAEAQAHFLSQSIREKLKEFDIPTEAINFKGVQKLIKDELETKPNILAGQNNPEKLDNLKNKLRDYIKEKIKPILYKPDIIETLKRDTLVELLGDLKTDYKNTAQKEIGYQKLRSEYPSRTIELRVGDIKTTDFNKATKLARVMESLGYLDTVSHITSNQLHDPQIFNAEKFYDDFNKNFIGIYKATLLGAGKDPDKNMLLREIKNIGIKFRNETDEIIKKCSTDKNFGTENHFRAQCEENINKKVYQLNKQRAEVHFDSMETFALSRAVEYRNQTIDAKQLFKETYEEGFKRSSIFSISKVDSGFIYRSSKLRESLEEKDMFQLHKEQKRHPGQTTRTGKVHDALFEIKDFAQRSIPENRDKREEETSVNQFGA
jgi:NTE family protein